MNIYACRPYEEYDPTIADYKRSIIERIQKARKSGVSAGKIAKASEGQMSIHTVYDMLNAEIFGKESWQVMDETLKKLGF